MIRNDLFAPCELQIRLDHHLGEATKAFAFYATGDIGGTKESNDYVAIGIQHTF